MGGSPYGGEEQERRAALRAATILTQGEGYGPPAILETLKRCEWFTGTDVVYLFFNNDLRDDNLMADMGFTCFEGYLVPKYKDDGTPYSGQEYRNRVHSLLEPKSPTKAGVLLQIGKLSHLRQRLYWRQSRFGELLDTQGPGGVHERKIRFLAYTSELAHQNRRG